MPSSPTVLERCKHFPARNIVVDACELANIVATYCPGRPSQLKMKNITKSCDRWTKRWPPSRRGCIDSIVSRWHCVCSIPVVNDSLKCDIKCEVAEDDPQRAEKCNTIERGILGRKSPLPHLAFAIKMQFSNQWQQEVWNDLMGHPVPRSRANGTSL